MSDLLAMILVGLVVVTALVSVFVILTGPSQEYSDSDYRRADVSSAASERKQAALAPARRSGDRRRVTGSAAGRTRSGGVRETSPGKKEREGVAG